MFKKLKKSKTASCRLCTMAIFGHQIIFFSYLIHFLNVII